jgi:hypothetical protein
MENLVACAKQSSRPEVWGAASACSHGAEVSGSRSLPGTIATQPFSMRRVVGDFSLWQGLTTGDRGPLTLMTRVTGLSRVTLLTWFKGFVWGAPTPPAPEARPLRRGGGRGPFVEGEGCRVRGAAARCRLEVPSGAPASSSAPRSPAGARVAAATLQCMSQPD